MTHEHFRLLVQRLADNELGRLRRMLAARHVGRCPSCAAEMESLLAMRAAIRSSLPFHRAPPGLPARIGGALPREQVPSRSRPWFRVPSLRFAGSGLAGALAGVALTVAVLHGGRSDDAMLNAVIGGHLRSMMADHLTDVATSDRHTVKPWLSARLDVSPPVPELAAEGYPLVGGRMDYIDGHRAAAIVYRYEKHVINLFAWKTTEPGNSGFHLRESDGFNVISWRADGVAYHAVSDVEADKLMRFAQLVGG